MTRPAPTVARIAATWSSMTFAIVQLGARPAMSRRKRSRTACPWGLCRTSGWYWTPARRRPRSSKAATGAPGEDAVTVNPGGATVTQSPCDIHTLWSVGWPAKSAASAVTVSGVPPNSCWPLFATVPPSACAIAWNP